jgi:leader peptidase (prepilin peptidase)/N-methyltransferase
MQCQRKNGFPGGLMVRGGRGTLGHAISVPKSPTRSRGIDTGVYAQTQCAPMSALVIALSVVVGLEVGSFLNVCIDRLPRKESVVRGRSHCEACGRDLTPLDLVPLFSYLALRGRCRTCAARIPRRIPVVEAITGAAYGALVVAYGLSATTGLLIVYTCILIVVFFIDLEQGLILNVIVYPSLVIALVAALIVRPEWLGGFVSPPLASAGLGAGVGFVFLFVVALVSRGGMGWGDVKFAAFMGAAAGFPLVLVALFVGVIIGGIAGAVLLLSGKRNRKQTIPFGPFLVAGTLATLLWGEQMLGLYLGLM